MIYLIHRNKYRESGKMGRQSNMFQSKEQYKISEKELPDKEFKVIVIKMLTELGRRMDEHSENLN